MNNVRIASPCIRNCCLDNNNICMGCFRSIDEITGWSQADDCQRKRFLDNAYERSMAHEQKGYIKAPPNKCPLGASRAANPKLLRKRKYKLGPIIRYQK